MNRTLSIVRANSEIIQIEIRRRQVMRRVLALFLLAVPLRAQPQGPTPVVSPEVRSDNRVTFRFRAPNAKEVFLAREDAQRVPMQKEEQGVWSVTTDLLEPDLYGYSFVADGVSLIDPANPKMKPSQGAAPHKR